MRGSAPVLAFLLLLSPVSAPAHPGAAEKIEILTQRIEAQPGAQRRYIDRGAAYAHDGQYSLALADLRKAEELGEPVLVSYQLGLLQQRMGELASARSSLDAFLERFPTHAPALEARARLLAALGETELALADFEQLFAAQRSPNPGSYVSAAKLLAAGDESGLARATEMLDRGLERLGVIPQLQQYAVELELQQGHTARAIERLETLKPALGQSADWKVAMGELLLRAGRSAEASQLFEDALAQLQTQRRTVARQRVLEKVQELLSRMDEQS